MRQTQRMWIEQELREKGSVTRNQALGRYISRLGAIVHGLRADGWLVEGSWKGRDYVYTLGDAPKRRVSEFEPVWIDGKIVARREVFKYV